MKEAASTRAILTLILGILSLACMSFFTGIPAIILGQLELAAIKRGDAPKAGEGMAKIGLIFGIIGTAFAVLTIFVILAFIWLGISFGDWEFMRSITSYNV